MTGTNRHVLLVSGDTLPLPGLPTTGAGLRAWGLGKGLESRGHAVTYLMPEATLKRLGVQVDLTAHHTIPYNHLDPNALDQQIVKQSPEAIVFQHWASAVCLTNPKSIPVALDFHGPLLLETLYQDAVNYESLREVKIRTLAKADFFTCAGEQQRRYFYPWLMLAGFDVRKNVIEVIPVSMSPERATRLPVDPQVTFVYGGVFLPWQNPSVSLETLRDVLEARQQGRLKLFGGLHTHIDVPSGKYRELIPSLQASPRVEFMGMIPRDELTQIYLHSHVAIDLMERNPERELAFTTRTVEYLWCGLPVIYNDYAELAAYIKSYDAGWTVDPTDTKAIREVIESILDDPAMVMRKSANAQRLVQEKLAWDATITPLDSFCRTAARRSEYRLTPLLRTDVALPLRQQSVTITGKTGRPKVLFISNVPLGKQLIGPAIRCWELARQVSAVADVTVAAYESAELQAPDIHTETYVTQPELMRIVEQHDVVVAQGSITEWCPGILKSGKVMVYDLYDPINLETLEHYRLAEPEIRDQHYEAIQKTLWDQLRSGDFYLCANERQRDYWIGMLAAAGRLNPSTYDVGERDLHNLLSLTPMGVSANAPSHAKSVLRGVHPAIHPDDIVLIWAGSLLDWLDPYTLIRSMKGVASQRDDVKLFFMSSRHPVVREAQAGHQAIELSRELGVFNRSVIFNENWIPYDERASYLTEADIGVTTHKNHLETRFSFRTRVLDYLWAGLPIISSDGDTFGDVVGSRNLGRVVPPGDVSALEQAILELAADADLRRKLSENVRALAREFTWDKVAQPLVDFCREPHHAPDLGARSALQSSQRIIDESKTAYATEETLKRARREVARMRRTRLARGMAGGKQLIKRVTGYGRTVKLFSREFRVSEPLIAGQRVTQTFIAERTQLSGIELLVATFGRVNTCDVTLHLQDGKSMQELAAITVNAMFMNDCAYCAFSFDSMADSAGQPFTFWVESADAVAGDCIALFYELKGTTLAYFPVYG